MTNPTADAQPIVILSYGQGVESHAILERWMHEPESRPFKSWEQLIVVTSQVGEEHRVDTVRDVERRTLPLLRSVGVRFVEVARRGLKEEDGIVILQDSRAPQRIHPDGVFKLSDELLLNGTVPQFGGEHRCAMKFKAYVIETWLAWEFKGKAERPIYHVFGYNADETSRINSSDKHIQLHNEDRMIQHERTPIVVFGYNSEEVGRIERNKKYDGPNRTGLYPLQEWGWNREKCKAYIMERCGIDWKKSACAFCPFSQDCTKGTPEAVARWNAAPEQTAHGVMVEFNALCFNPRGTLYKDRALMDQIRKHNVQPVLDAFEKRLAAMEWGFYRVRRIYTKKGNAVRAVERIETGTREQMAARFTQQVTTEPELQVKEVRGISYAMFAHREEEVYPTREGFYVIAPAFVDTKVRGAMEKFEERWNRVALGLPMNGEPVDPAQDQIPLEYAAA